jgi:hypothetical protein
MEGANVQFLGTLGEPPSKVTPPMDAPAGGRYGGRSAAPSRRGQEALDAVMLALSAALPACLAATRVGNVADAAHDGGVARVIGVGAQAWRSLDVPAGLLLAAVPVGTLAARTAMAGALVIGAIGGILFGITRQLLRACADSPRLGSLVAAIVTLATLSIPAWQLEAATTGGAVSGALLVFLPLVLLVHGREAPAAGASGTVRARWAMAAAALGLAISQEPLVGACALGGVAAFVATDRRDDVKLDWGALGGCILIGAAPLLFALVRMRASGVSMASALGDDWAGERGSSASGSPIGFIRSQVGGMTTVLCVAGIALAALVRRARALIAALVAILVVGFASGWAGAPVGVTRFGAPLLAAAAAECAIAGVAIQAIARAVASARVPFARSSAAVVLALALVFPVEGAEQSLAASLPRGRGAAAVWDDVAWGTLPPRAVVFIGDRGVYARAAAARAVGSLRGDVAVVATVAPPALVRRALARDPSLLPLWRDIEFSGAPSEESLSLLAAARPLAIAYEARWGRTIARHLVPLALFDRFAPEPRGTSDRRRGLDAFAPKRDRLTAALDHEPELAAAAAHLLEARALAMSASGDRDIIERAFDDARAFGVR